MFLILKIKKLKFEKAQFSNNGAIQLYIAREGSGYSGKLSDPDPAKRSGSDQIRNPAKKGRLRSPGEECTVG